MDQLVRGTGAEKMPGREVPLTDGDDDLTGWLRLIKSEYFEMPGLHLTKRQVQRLWGLDARRCDIVLNALEASHFLKRTSAGVYVRALASM